MNLLEEAKRNGVKKFIFVSVLNGEKLRHLKICNAKELSVGKLKKSGLDSCTVRPNGFFSDMSEFFNMVKRGRFHQPLMASVRQNQVMHHRGIHFEARSEGLGKDVYFYDDSCG